MRTANKIKYKVPYVTVLTGGKKLVGTCTPVYRPRHSTKCTQAVSWAAAPGEPEGMLVPCSKGNFVRPSPLQLSEASTQASEASKASGLAKEG